MDIKSESNTDIDNYKLSIRLNMDTIRISEVYPIIEKVNNI